MTGDGEFGDLPRFVRQIGVSGRFRGVENGTGSGFTGILGPFSGILGHDLAIRGWPAPSFSHLALTRLAAALYSSKRGSRPLAARPTSSTWEILKPEDDTFEPRVRNVIREAEPRREDPSGEFDRSPASDRRVRLQRSRRGVTNTGGTRTVPLSPPRTLLRDPRVTVDHSGADDETTGRAVRGDIVGHGTFGQSRSRGTSSKMDRKRGGEDGVIPQPDRMEVAPVMASSEPGTTSMPFAVERSVVRPGRIVTRGSDEQPVAAGRSVSAEGTISPATASSEIGKSASFDRWRFGGANRSAVRFAARRSRDIASPIEGASERGRGDDERSGRPVAAPDDALRRFGPMSVIGTDLLLRQRDVPTLTMSREPPVARPVQWSRQGSTTGRSDPSATGSDGSTGTMRGPAVPEREIDALPQDDETTINSGRVGTALLIDSTPEEPRIVSTVSGPRASVRETSERRPGPGFASGPRLTVRQKSGTDGADSGENVDGTTSERSQDTADRIGSSPDRPIHKDADRAGTVESEQIDDLLDVDRLVDRVLRKFKRNARIERERRGR